MSGAVNGVLVILGVGLALLGLATVLDWRSARRAETALTQPPDRGEAMAHLPIPQYVPEPAERDRPRRSPLSVEEQRELDADLATSDRHDLDLVLADERLATHITPLRAILRGPLVVVCPEGVGSVRELLATLERAAQQHSPLIIAAPRFDPELLDVMAINADRGTLQALPLRGGAEECLHLATVSGATGLTRADLQSGYVPHAVYGRALLCVAGDDQTVVVVPPR